ncbi:hypothetical protein [Caballeronia sp. S22]|uniref:hypothetical protein n=1 Tax=Caballeronia sp. S22 TaxID=3137182 RepID=UPI0035312E61
MTRADDGFPRSRCGSRKAAAKDAGGWPAFARTTNIGCCANSHHLFSRRGRFRRGNDFVGVGGGAQEKAVREKNGRTMAAHIAALSRQMTGEHLAFDESAEGTLEDGIN